MSSCVVKRVTAVEPHPREDRSDLNVIRTADANFVSQKVEMVHPRYAVGDLVIHIPHGARLRPELQERLGAREPRIRAGNFAGVRSEGMLLPASEVRADAAEGDDVTAELGIIF